MKPFVHTSHPGRVVFGRGSLERVGDEVDRLGLERPLVLASPQQADLGERVATMIGKRAAGVFAEAAMHTPVAVTERAMAVVAACRADGVVSVGGGSAIGLGKAIAYRSDLPQIAIPTTYAGSEMTPILGETRDGAKETVASTAILPEVVIYDVDLTLGLPSGLSGTSGLNAMAHAVEALYTRDSNPVVAMMAEEGVRSLAEALPRIADEPHDPDARDRALYGAWLCGICLGSVGMALHHKLCHTLGGTFDLPHAATHAVILPHALAYNAPAIPDAMAALTRALGGDPPGTLYNLGKRIGAPSSLREIGMPADGIDRAVDQALARPYWNPRPVEAEGIRSLLVRAYAGLPPGERL